jgi:serine/threonine protein kinase
MTTEILAGRYEIERPLGHGAMAVVDLARDRELDRHVALKRLAENLSRDDDLRARFLREGRLAARLAHPNIVRVFDVGETDGRPYIAMEYVEGETLADLLARRGTLTPAEATELGVQIARALTAAHAAGLVHRDVKPHNLLIRRDGVLKLGDFGIAVGLEGTRFTVAGTVLGTAAYLAPEQARGEQVTSAADVYALGLVLVELVTGHPDRVRVGGPLGETINRCLANNPRDRPTAAEVERELRGEQSAAPTVILPRRRPRRAPMALAGVAALTIAAGIAAAVATSGGGSKPPRPRPAPIAPLQHASTAQQQAQNIASWLLRYSR